MNSSKLRGRGKGREISEGKEEEGKRMECSVKSVKSRIETI